MGDASHCQHRYSPAAYSSSTPLPKASSPENPCEPVRTRRGVKSEINRRLSDHPGIVKVQGLQGCAPRTRPGAHLRDHDPKPCAGTPACEGDKREKTFSITQNACRLVP